MSGLTKHADVTEVVVSAFFKVYGTLGYGFLERVYQNSMMIELAQRGMKAIAQAPLVVTYGGEIVGEYFADILVNDCVIVEIKATTCILNEHHAQVINYLKATGLEVGLLLNFGPKPEVKRKVHDAPGRASPRG